MVVVGCGGVIAFSAIGVWSGNEKFYEKVLTPLVLNRIDPETSHRLAVFAAKYHLFKSAPKTVQPVSSDKSSTQSSISLVS